MNKSLSLSKDTDLLSIRTICLVPLDMRSRSDARPSSVDELRLEAVANDVVSFVILDRHCKFVERAFDLLMPLLTLASFYTLLGAEELVQNNYLDS